MKCNRIIYKLYFLYIFKILSKSVDLLDLLDKKIYINSASHINFRLGEDLSAFGNDIFTFYNYPFFTSENKYVGTSKIEKYDDQYKIKIGSYYLCSYDGELQKCENNDFFWSITPKIFGYTISNNKRCLTIDKKLKLDDCKDSKNQEFVFELRPLVLDCLDSLTSLIEKSYTDDEERNKKLIEDAIKVHNLDVTDDVLDTIMKKLQSNTDPKKFMENELPGIENSEKMQRIVDALHQHTWNWAWIRAAVNWLMDFFCPKD